MKIENLPNIDDIKSEQDALNQSTALNKIVVELLEGKKKENFRSWMAFIFACIIFIVSIIFIVFDNQKVRNDLIGEMALTRSNFTKALVDERTAWIEYVKTLETTKEINTETTTQTIEGDGSALINGNQYNDSSIHNGNLEKKVGE